ncbi:galactose oxidase-like domain-containing protein [Kineococcus sp. LSe6-4]|uniref:Galactose oxidase-like domain-containing protein n=1 Tax=Kineococcus halophytocola TaxID=3234027 RepID=A0ABV4GWE8_9ACTN
MTIRTPHLTGRRRRVLLAGLATVGLLAVNAGPAVGGARSAYTAVEVRTNGYKAANGSWSTLDMPADVHINAIHAALLNTGKVLIIAGSGNDRENFAAGTFRSIVWDPAGNTFEEIPTPEDMFCSGHAFLPDGRLVVAGGTQRYEILEGDVTHAAGAMTVKNENPDSAPLEFAEGTRFTSPDGHVYQATNAFTLPPATKVDHGGGDVMIHASEVVVWVEALEAGTGPVTLQRAQYAVGGLSGSQADDVYGLAEKMTLDKQDYQGTQTTYVFDPRTERYDRVADMKYKRWYPTVVALQDGSLLANSGLDGTGQVLTGQTEVFDPKTMTWAERVDLTRYFPTYPWLYPMADGRLFYSGSNTGYGPADAGRTPGVWDLTDNTFDPVPGLADADQLETSGSVMLPPVQDQTAMIVGGGGVGESPKSSARTATVDLTAADPHYVTGPSLPEGTRYPNLVNLPDDQTLITGGSKDYRGKGDSDNRTSLLYDAATGAMRQVASQRVGRDYHTEALLLPDGRVVVLGSNPLFADEDNTVPADFEQRIEVYSPPYLFDGTQPALTAGPDEIRRGGTATFTLGGDERVATAKLMRPSAVTHSTDVEQRTVALEVERTGDQLTVGVPGEAGIVPDGWYMLFVTTAAGVPSQAKWVHVSGPA